MATVVKNRALSLATRGLLGGSVLALATHGLLQTPQEVAPPIELPPAVATGGGGSSGQYVDYIEAPRRYAFTSNFTLLIDPASISSLSHRPPPKIETVQLLRGRYVSRYWVLYLSAGSEARFFDQVADDEEAIILAAARYIFGDDDDGFIL